MNQFELYHKRTLYLVRKNIIYVLECEKSMLHYQKYYRDILELIIQNYNRP